MRAGARRTAWTAAVAIALVGVAVLGLGCGSAAAPRQPQRQRVVLISLDGASAFELWNLHRAGKFSAQGFGRFFADGEVARGLVEIDPPMTSPSHISLVTGYAPERTGIVGNWFHPPGEPLLLQQSGFLAPIATETLWEAARRQKLRVGVVAWPGADNTDRRRRGDWGLSYTDVPQRPSRTLVLGPADFSPADASPAGRVHVVALPPRGLGDVPRPAAAGAVRPTSAVERLELAALDRTDDGRENFDALSVRSLDAGANLVLSPGEWGRLWLPPLEGAGTAPLAMAVRLARLDPDLGHVEIYLGAIYPTPAYPEAFAARLAAAEVAWPGAPDGRALEQAGRGEPGLELEAWLEQSAREAAFFVDVMLAGARSEPWDLLLGYLPSIDTAGHEFLLEDPRQAGYSPARVEELRAIRARVWQAVDRHLARLLAELDLESTTVMLVSDHGMTPVHSMVDANLALARAGWQEIDPQTGEPAAASRASAAANSGLAHINLNLAGREPEGTVPAEQAAAAVEELRRLFLGMRSEREPVFRDAFSRAQAGAIGLDHPHSGDLVVRTAPGFWLGSDRKRWRLPDGTLAEPVVRSAELGKHGFPSGEPRMHGIALALGAQVEPARPDLVSALTVAPRVARWLGIEPPRAAPP